MNNRITIFVDGACSKSNPTDKIGYAAIIDSKVYADSTFDDTGKLSNNEAEYRALKLALDNLPNHVTSQDVFIYSDSMLVVQQVNGLWRVRSNELRSLVTEVRDQFERMKGTYNIELIWIPRSENMLADAASKKALLL